MSNDTLIASFGGLTHAWTSLAPPPVYSDTGVMLVQFLSDAQFQWSGLTGQYYYGVYRILLPRFLVALVSFPSFSSYIFF